MKKSQKLVLAQLITPLFRLFFAFLLIPSHPRGEEILSIFIFAELLSTIAVMGRNTLISAGYDHSYINRYADVLVVVSVSCLIFYVFSSNDQKELIYPVLVTTIGLWALNIFSAYCLRKGNYLLLILTLFLSYAIAFLSIYANVYIAILFFAIYVLTELMMERFKQKTLSRFSCGSASLVSLLSQKFDMQLALLIFGLSISADIFKLNVLFMPLAIVVRIFSNTALITGKRIIKNGLNYFCICLLMAALYSTFIYIVSFVYEISLIHSFSGLLIISASVLLAFLNIPYREVISSVANGGNFNPMLKMSLYGFFPFILLLVTVWGNINISIDVFLIFCYFLPRLFIYLYSMYYCRYSRGVTHD